ncbi:MAG: HAD hydrolase family protein [Lachnospiraceae bacterium]|nr:HAD hydrolase family protein [Lachnospiraceae bacterium]
MSKILPTIDELKESGAIFYDFDGVMTDNRVLVSDTGSESVFCNRSDGLAISEFRRLGIHQAIISTETNPVVARRAEKLHIPVVHKLDSIGTDKGQVLERYCAENGVDLKSSIFIGNDINDLPALKLVGYPCCPADAYQPVKDIAVWISTKNGGYGVIRELMDVLIP